MKRGIFLESLWNTVRESATFLLVSLAVFVGVFLLALLAEKCNRGYRRRVSGIRYTATVAIFAAIGGVLMLVEIPLFFAPEFYKLDLSELPTLLCSFYLGPVAGILAELLKITLKLLLKGTTTAFVGEFANFCVGASFLLPASVIFSFRRSKKAAILSTAVGTAVLTVFGSLFNAFYFLPKFTQLYGIPMEAILSMSSAVNPAIVSVPTLVLFAIVPFNLLKGIIVSLIACLLYTRLEKVLFKGKGIQTHEN